MNKDSYNVKDYRLQFADGRIYSYPCLNDLQAKFYARHLISTFVDGKPNSYRLIKGRYVRLYVVSYKDDTLSYKKFIGKVYPFKSKYFKAVNLWSGKRTLVPVSSLHVVHCAICKYLTDDFAGVCNRCQGCLDCRGTYYRPVTQSVSFIELLDTFVRYNDLPF